MRTRLFDVWQRLLGSLWFVPGAIVLAAGVLAFQMIDLSSRVDSEWLGRFPRLFGADAESSRSMLTAIASSIITVAGVTFSITVVAVTQASNQYTPRILRTFMNDRRSQVALGVLVGVFVYCLIVVRTVRGGDGSFVPAIAVLGAFVLAIVAIGCFVYFIHHVASSLDAGAMIERISAETVVALERTFPEATSAGPTCQPLRAAERDDWQEVPSCRTGYIQNVDAEGLLELACKRGIIVRMERGVGEFLAEGAVLASIAPGGGPDRELSRALSALYTVQSHRTVHQDPAFGIRQMVDIALKALSPGVNDSTTAATCVDYLGAVLLRLVNRETPNAYRVAGGELRVIARVQDFDHLLDLALDEIRRNACTNVAVLQRMLDTLARVAAAASAPPRRTRLREHAGRILQAAERSIESHADREEVTRAYERAQRAIDRRARDCAP